MSPLLPRGPRPAALKPLARALTPAGPALIELLTAPRPTRPELQARLEGIGAKVAKELREPLDQVPDGAHRARRLFAELAGGIGDCAEAFVNVGATTVVLRVGKLPSEAVDAASLLTRCAELIGDEISELDQPSHRSHVLHELARLRGEADAAILAGLARLLDSEPNIRTALSTSEVFRALGRLSKTYSQLAITIRRIGL